VTFWAFGFLTIGERGRMVHRLDDGNEGPCPSAGHREGTDRRGFR